MLRPREVQLQSCGIGKASWMTWYLKSPTGRNGDHQAAFKDASCSTKLLVNRVACT